ncbi:MAG: hypothetical protein LKF37_03655 [Lentilactobacillus diolivorans]|jgi:uncharacterized protein YdeI (BOF family)|uniref:hypothetical protein n=1 Tax=Lentilactobacillus diolivorans TaxID=179838 RepID=UPI0023527C7F|nr:hypothetical protein [Lentilactobacillus diolivorans]MCH4163860.1 hypothetical protein [Lentilactobacillus diolivorans]MDH5106022.1 hypothetical protein [Lentilactobacillus diolivorans]
MKTSKSLAAIFAVVASVTLILAGCGNSSKKSSNPSSKTSMQNPTADKSAKEALTSNNNLWYMNGTINYKSKTGIDAYKFNKENNTVTIYSVDKMYKTYNDAKKANDLNKQGTLTYSFKNTSSDNPVLYMKGKLSDIPMDQTVSVKDKVAGKNHEANLKVAGYKVVRDLDNDPAKQVLVTPTD